MYEENEKSIFNYNMLFNKINSDNLDEKIDYNTNLISDINLQNFDIKRYEYYTNLLYIYNKDPATLYNLLKKYYNIKNFKSKERKIIKYISNYARLLKYNPDQEDTNPSSANKDDVTNVREKLLTNALPSSHTTGGALEKYKKLITELSTKIPTKKKRDDAVDVKNGYTEKGSFVTDVVKKNTNAEVATDGLAAPNPRPTAAAPVVPVDPVDPVDDAADDAAADADAAAAAADADAAAAAAAAAADADADAPVDDAADERAAIMPAAVLDDVPVAADADVDIATTEVLIEDIPLPSQTQSFDKRLLKMAMKHLKNLTTNKQPQQHPQIEKKFKKDELITLNEYFTIVSSYFTSFKFRKDELIYEIYYPFNITDIKEIVKFPTTFQRDFDNFIELLKSHTIDLFLNYNISSSNKKIFEINIKYKDFNEFLYLLNDKLRKLLKFITDNNLAEKQFLKINTNFAQIYHLIDDLSQYLHAILTNASLYNKENSNGKILLKIRNFILGFIYIIDQDKYKSILTDFNRPEQNIYLGGNLNDKLKIKYLDTKKYKELKKTKTEGEIDELETYKENQNYDDDDDMNKIGQLSIDIDNYYDSTKDKKSKDKFIIQQINNFENDPKNPLEELAITFDDRIVFIIVTFFIRYITIIMVQWCIDINIIKTFYEGFIYYAIIYIIIFWFIVLFINIDNSFDVKYMNFNGIINSIRTLFYYFYMGTNGITRLLIHTSLIILLIIIPIILNIKNKTEFKDENEDEDVKILNYDERKQLSKTLSLFTMFIWLFTSIIATKF